MGAGVEQDHETVVFRRPRAPERGVAQDARAQRAGAVERKAADGDLKHAAVPHELRLAIARARQAKGWTQAELAQRLGVKPKDVNEYESGRAVPENQFVARMERALGAKLPRAPR